MNIVARLLFVFIHSIILIVIIFSPHILMAQNPENASKKTYSPAIVKHLFDLSLEELMNIEVVTASKVTELLPKSTSDVTVFTDIDLKRSGVLSYHDILWRVPGLIMFHERMGQKSASLQGVRANKILTLIDGHVLNDPETGSAMNQFIDELPVENIKQIEVVRGPGSALYGANAFLGVINIITKNAEDVNGIELSTVSEFEYSNYIGQKYNLLGGYQFNDNINMIMNINYLDEEGPDLNVDSDTFDRTGKAYPGREQLDIQAKSKLCDFYLRGRYFQRKGEGFFGVQHVLGDGSDVRTYGGHAEIEWIHKFGKDLKMKAVTYFDHVYIDNYFVVYPPGTIPAGHTFEFWNGTGLTINPKLKKTCAGGEFQTTFYGLKRNTFVGGIAYRYENQYDPQLFANINPAPLPTVQDVSDEFNWIDSGHRHIFSAYIQDIFDVLDVLRITTGIRMDRFSDFGFTFNPRIGLAWRIWEQLYFRTSYGSAFRAPSFGDQYVMNNPAFIGNPDLNPEKIRTVDASLSFNYKKSFHTTLTYFHSELEEMILTVEGEMYKNSGKTQVDGGEIQGRYYFRKTAYVNAYYALSYVKVLTGSETPFPDSTMGLDINLVLWERLSWNVNLYRQDKWKRDDGDSRSSMDDYVLVNTTLLFNVWEKHNLRFSIFNLFNENYAFPARMGTYKDDFTAPERSYVVEFSLKF